MRHCQKANRHSSVKCLLEGILLGNITAALEFIDIDFCLANQVTFEILKKNIK